MKFLYPKEVKNMPKPEWIFHELLQVDSLALLYGPSGLGKSFVALEMAFAVATGDSSIFEVSKTGPVVYIVGEGLAGIGSRIEAWELNRNTHLPDTNPAFLGDALQIAEGKDIKSFAKAIKVELEEEPLLIIFDTLARCAVGLDENSAKDMGTLIAGLDQLRKDFGSTLLVVHHSTKSSAKTERGSGAIYGAADTVLSLTPDGKYLSLQCPKQKNWERAPTRRIDLKPVGESCVLNLETVSKEKDRQDSLNDILLEKTDPVTLPKAVFAREYFPPEPFDARGRVCSVTVMGSKVKLEQVDKDDSYLKAWIQATRNLRQKHKNERAEANLFEYITLPFDMSKDKLIESRRQIREDRFAGRLPPYPAIDDLELAYWCWAVDNCGITQAEVLRWYDMPRGTLRHALTAWKKYGLLPVKD